MAICVFVVLRNGYNVNGGVFFQSRSQVFENGLIGLFAGEAGVWVIAIGLAVVVAVVFTQPTKGVNEQAAAVKDFSAVYFAFLAVVCVDTVFGAPIGVYAYGMPSQAAQFKIRLVNKQVGILNDNVAFGNHFKRGGKVTNACVFFQKFINTVKNTALVAAANGHASFLAAQGCVNREAVLLKGDVSKENDGEATVDNLNLFEREILCKLLTCKHFNFAQACNDVNALEGVFG